MPVPAVRNKLLPARGNFTDLSANAGTLLDGEICYAIDQDQYYQKEGSVLVSVGATKAQGLLADTALQPLDNVSELTNDAGYITQANGIEGFPEIIITDPVNDQSLIYDGGDWVNGSPPVLVEVKNDLASTLTKGTPVYVSGTHNSGKPLVSPADNDGVSTYPAIGLVHQDMTGNAEGYVVVSGLLAGLNTSSYSDGEPLYISNTAGVLTTTRPTADTQQVQKVALVTRSHQTVGSVIVMGAGRVNDISNEVQALLGVNHNSINLGVFNGSIIPDNQTIKSALAALEAPLDLAILDGDIIDGGTY